MTIDNTVQAVTSRIQERSRPTRERYLARIEAAAGEEPHRTTLSCGNLAHGFAACGMSDKQALSGANSANIAIVSADNMSL